MWCRYSVLPEKSTSPVCEGEEEEEEEEGKEKEGEEEKEWGTEVTLHDQQLPMLVLPLYSLLSAERQAEVRLPLSLHCQYCTLCVCAHARAGI